MVQVNPHTMAIQTPTKVDNVNKRTIFKVVYMEVYEQSSRKRSKVEKEMVVVLLEEEEESINQGGHVAVVEEEKRLTNI